MSHPLGVLWLAGAVVLLVARLAAPCSGVLDRATVVRCALLRSTEVRAARQQLEVLAGRRRAAGTWLPSYPVLSVALAERRGPAGLAPAGSYLNWYMTLTQEIEIAGQRRVRLDLVDAEAAAAVRRAAAAEREAAAAALGAYYELLAAQEQLVLARELGAVAARLGALGAARAAQELLAPVEADVAQAEATRLALARPEAERRLGAARAQLGALLDLPGLVDVRGELGELPPPPVEMAPTTLLERALTLRGDVEAAEMERRAREVQVRLLRRARVPHLVLGFTAQRDGFDERVLGGSLALALPLPAPIGPSLAGEIAAARGEVAQAETRLEQVRRQVRLEVLRALASERAYRDELALYAPELLARAREDLRALTAALGAQRLPLREALLSQRSLIELLQARLRSGLGMALSRVELLRATGGLP